MIENTLHYPIHIGADLYDVTSWLPTLDVNQIVIITDNAVKKRHGLRLQKALKRAGYNTLLLSFPTGEKSKTRKTKEALENAMLRHRCDRYTLILALGGGVVGDVAGFIAATYLRGIPYIQLPTTLLAMVDSSVGGKTAINTTYGKNLIGAVYHPVSVVADIALLKSLPKEHLICGYIEAIKMFLTHDHDSFNYAEAHLDDVITGKDNILKELVARAVKIKAGVVSRDEKERDERSLLNFGHTIGHALEKITDYRLLHAYAVAYGILVESSLSHLLGLLDKKHLAIINQLFARLGFKGSDLQSYSLTKLITATKHDKKAKSGQVHYALLNKIGSAYTTNNLYAHPVDDKIVRQAIKYTIEG